MHDTPKNGTRIRKILTYWLGALVVVIATTVGVLDYIRRPVDVNAQAINGLEARQSVDDQRYVDINRRLAGLEDGQKSIISSINLILRLLQ